MSIKKNKTVIVASESPDLYTSARLIEEARKLNYTALWLNPYQEIVSELLRPEKNTTYFHRTTGVRYDDFDLLLARHFEAQGVKVSNPTAALQTFRDKELQSLFFKRHGLSQIPTVSYRGILKENYWDAIRSLSRDQKYVIKMSRGNQGIGVNLINGVQSLKSILETFHAMKDQRFIIQPYIEHKKEYRIFVIKNEVAGIVEKTMKLSDFRGNSKRTIGKAKHKINAEIKKEILRAASLSGLDYFGADVLIDKNDFYFLELNPVPGFQQMEELSGKNIARELLVQICL